MASHRYQPTSCRLACRTVSLVIDGRVKEAVGEPLALRHFHRLELAGPASPGTPSVFGRFEANHPNELWTGDALHGPRLAGRTPPTAPGRR
jgi:hypothetical protein